MIITRRLWGNAPGSMCVCIDVDVLRDDNDVHSIVAGERLPRTASVVSTVYRPSWSYASCKIAWARSVHVYFTIQPAENNGWWNRQWPIYSLHLHGKKIYNSAEWLLLGNFIFHIHIIVILDNFNDKTKIKCLLSDSYIEKTFKNGMSPPWWNFVYDKLSRKWINFNEKLERLKMFYKKRIWRKIRKI